MGSRFVTIQMCDTQHTSLCITMRVDLLAMFIAFEGPIAAGKTTLASLYGNHLGCPVLYESFAANSFLADYYIDRDRWALPMQLWFLMSRHDQLIGFRSEMETHSVADYAFVKNRIFANLILPEREKSLFAHISETLRTNAPKPDVIVHLDANNDVLLQRIKLRGREFERSINGSYLNSLRAAYNEELSVDSSCVVVPYDTTNLNLDSRKELEELFSLIDGHLR